MTLSLPLRCSKSSAMYMASYMSRPVPTFHMPTASSRELCKQWKASYRNAKNLVLILTSPCCVCVAPLLTTIFHHQQSYWAQECTKPTYRRSLNQAYPFLLMVISMQSFKQDRNKSHSMTKRPSTSPWFVLMTQCVSSTRIATNGNLALSSVTRRLPAHMSMTWQMVAPADVTAATFALQEKTWPSTKAATWIPAEPTPSLNEDSPPTSLTTCPQTVVGGVDREATLRRSSRVIKPPDRLNLWTETLIELIELMLLDSFY